MSITSKDGVIRQHFRIKDGRRVRVPFWRAERDAHLVGSLLTTETGGKRLHAPVIDIDVPMRLIPSATPGHSHLYIDVPMSDAQFGGLLYAMVKAGVVEDGYANASVKRGQTFVRTPWAPKGVGPALDGGGY